MTITDLRRAVIGIDTRVPLLDGSERPYVFLDNAASTPTLRPVLDAVERFLPWYSGVHRGTGFKSLLATEMFDRAHDIIGAFVGADPASNTVVFTKNTTECVNKLANRCAFRPDDVVITTVMEHHSNDLPWRRTARVVHIGMTAEGRIDIPALRTALHQHRGRVRLVAVHGASNITGLCAPVHDIARWTHEAGARLFVDAAQLAPHRPVAMLPDDDPRHIDFLALSAHKMYAPFGTGALVGPRAFFEEGPPDMVGGGVVDLVTLDAAEWNEPPHKEEAGSPNVVGAIAMAAAAGVLRDVGMESIAEHEHELLTYAYGKLRGMKRIVLYGPTDNLREKVGVVTFNIEGMHNALAAAILSAEAGIGVRNGCFCAHPYVKLLLRLSPEEDARFTAEVRAGDKRNLPGMVRASFGCYNTREDVDALLEALGRIVRGEVRGEYDQAPSSGVYHARGFAVSFDRYFSLPGGGAHRTASTPGESS
jgi:selenocysteine lyase/cysteine desulfurase